MSGVEVIIKNLNSHPQCPHGPTTLFSRRIDNTKRRNFFACSACRDRKQCQFFVYEDELTKWQTSGKQQIWNEQINKYKQLNHRKLFQLLSEIRGLPADQRLFCYDCGQFQVQLNKHLNHKHVRGVSDDDLLHPTEFLSPLENAKKEAQFLFAKSSVVTLIDIFAKLNYKNVICVGAPRIHEFIITNTTMTSLLLDIDKRFHSFYGPLQFCWYNMFNHHFFSDEAKIVFDNFLQTDSGENMVLITDPPFGGRIEMLAHTIQAINDLYRSLNRIERDLPVMWAFPYFMEPQLLNHLPNYRMLDYKVDYDNHPLFQDGNKGRKFGSPVRIFTNINPSQIVLPVAEGYKYCALCNRWVSPENKHCKLCGLCASKDGRTYTHCNRCNKCVKPSWIHCDKCQRCAQIDHKCGNEIIFSQECFHCKESGHKKRDCPKINHKELYNKRKKQRNEATKSKKHIKLY